MRLRLPFVRFLLLIALGGVAALLYGTTLPESYPLVDADAVPSPVDDKLAKWVADHAGKKNPLKFSSKEFTKAVEKQDEVTGLYLKLAYANRGKYPDKGAPAEVLKEVRNYLQENDEGFADETFSHPLTPYLFLEVLRTEAIAPEDHVQALAGLIQTGTGSCAQKRFILDEINPDGLRNRSVEGLLDVLNRVAAFRSYQFKRLAFVKYLDALPKDKRDAVQERLLVLMQPYGSLVAKTPWLKKFDEEQKARTLKQPEKGFLEAKKASKKRRCQRGEQYLLKALTKVESADSLDMAMDAAKAVGLCHRRRGTEARLEFWGRVTDPMEKAFGFSGWAAVKHQHGYILWSADEFTTSRAIFSDIVEKSRKAENKATEAEALFVLARVAENEGKIDEAIKFYHEFTRKFTAGENYVQAVMSLALLHFDRAEWNDALLPLNELLQSQSEKLIDDRAVGPHAFALFWAGRLYQELGRSELAVEMWRQVASEYYSTFYGALGHYMLENSIGRKLTLEPSRSEAFRMHKLQRAFDSRGRRIVRRTEKLLSLGLTDEAVCELAELDISDSQPEKIAAKALLLHGAGEWLESIKTYDSLPRSFRRTMPIGSERFLFPRRYVEYVNNYSKRAGVDPDFVLGLIRQESVFNPMARSHAGARGLMQLMPRTAQLESRQLSRKYLPLKDRKSLRSKARKRSQLYDADTNLALGVHHLSRLFSKYKSPVFALAAYNASPTASERWQRQLPSKDILSFIERIPYKETRNYVKLVLRNYFYYKRWYESPKSHMKHFDSVTQPILTAIQRSPTDTVVK